MVGPLTSIKEYTGQLDWNRKYLAGFDQGIHIWTSELELGKGIGQLYSNGKYLVVPLVSNCQ